MATQLLLKRAYDEASGSDGFRILVDRLWPRGVSTARANLDLWAKDVAPSTPLRKAWLRDDEHFADYAADYRAELDANDAAAVFVEQVRRHQVVTLIFASRDRDHNHASVLRDWLSAKLCTADMVGSCAQSPKPRSVHAL